MGQLIERGNFLHLITDDGKTLMYTKTGSGVWTGPELFKEGGTPGGGGGGSGDFDGEGTNPGAFSARDASGVLHQFKEHNMGHAVNVYNVCAGDSRMTEKVLRTVFITMIVESWGLRMFANPMWPASFNVHYCGVGQDHSSVGLYQQRPDYGWGTVEQCMDEYDSTMSFLGGPTGPRKGSSPRGLFDVNGWQSMPEGQLAQTVQVSAHPGRYANVIPVANAMIEAIRGQ